MAVGLPDEAVALLNYIHMWSGSAEGSGTLS